MNKSPTAPAAPAGAAVPARRRILKGAAALGATAAVGPWIVSPQALASSGELNVLMWSDYLPDSWKAAFESETGITLNHTGIGSNEEIINQMKASGGCSVRHLRTHQQPLRPVGRPGTAATLGLRPDRQYRQRQPVDAQGGRGRNGTSPTRARTGCRRSGVPRASAGAPTCSSLRAVCRATAMSGQRRMPARP